MCYSLASLNHALSECHLRFSQFTLCVVLPFQSLEKEIAELYVLDDIIESIQDHFMILSEIKHAACKLCMHHRHTAQPNTHTQTPQHNLTHTHTHTHNTAHPNTHTNNQKLHFNRQYKYYITSPKG